VLADRGEAEIWRQHEARIWPERDGVGAAETETRTVLKLSVLPSNVAPLLQRMQDVAQDITCHISGRAAMGVMFIALTGALVRHTDPVARLRTAARELGGTAVILTMPLELRAQFDPFGDIGDALPLMRSIKQQFDPNGTLSPGRAPWTV